MTDLTAGKQSNRSLRREVSLKPIPSLFNIGKRLEISGDFEGSRAHFTARFANPLVEVVNYQE